jgi:queuine tRNA-ribosyltransferase
VLKFEIKGLDPGSSARAGEITTERGTIETPIFMPVGTVGTVKGVYQQQLEQEIKAQIILGNTYHLFLRPGMQVLQQMGGLHAFMNWHKPILTDSGGFQVYSLAERRKLSEDGVKFQSHIDGSRHLFTPENVVDTQRIIGSDIMMALDECTPYPCEEDYARKSMHLTHRWLDRGISRFRETEPLYGKHQSYFPIVQGSVYPALRRESAGYIAEKGAEGNAIGGLSVGEPAEQMYELTGVVCEVLPRDKPRYLMGVGTPANLIECISLGVDMFDCVMPTRNARNGMLFTRNGIMNMRNEKWKTDDRAIDESGTADVDHLYSRAYLRHLFIAEERLAGMIASVHNLAFYLALVKEARREILAGTFSRWKKETIENISRRL